MHRPLIVVVLVLFSALSGAALWEHGYWGIIAPHFASLGGGQVLADLVIALTLVMAWVWRNGDMRAACRISSEYALPMPSNRVGSVSARLMV